MGRVDKSMMNLDERSLELEQLVSQTDSYMVLADSLDEAEDLAQFLESRMDLNNFKIVGVGQFSRFTQVMEKNWIKPGTWFMLIRLNNSLGIINTLEQMGIFMRPTLIISDRVFIASIQRIPERPKFGKVYNTPAFDLYIYSCYKALKNSRSRILSLIKPVSTMYDTGVNNCN